MKNPTLLTALLAITFGVNIVPTYSALCGDPRHAVPFLRAYHPNAVGDHFYTTDAAEMQRATTQLGYIAEGTTGYIFADQQPGTVAFYRMYHPVMQDHFYTVNQAERNNAINVIKYNDEGIAGYVYLNDVCGGFALYREYSPAQQDHFYTMSQEEAVRANKSLGYNLEQIAGYLLRYEF